MGILKSMSESLSQGQNGRSQPRNTLGSKPLGGNISNPSTSMTQNVANNLNGNSILMNIAQQRGNRMAAQRGLQNSTLGAEASQRAMIDAAMPIAQIDTQNQFTANQAGLDRSHQLTMQRGQQDFTANQANLDRSHQRGLTQLQGEINYNNQSRLNQAQNQFASNQANLDRSHQTNMARLNSELQHNNTMKELGSQVSANTIGKSIDFAMQIYNNFDAQIAAVQTNNQMTAENKKKAIDQLLQSRNIQMKFLENFMQNIPTTHQGWTNFPSLKFPTLKEFPTTLNQSS